MTKNAWSIGDVALWLDAAPVDPVGRASGRMSGELVTIELLDDGRPCLVRNGAGVGYDPRPQPCRLLAIPALRSPKMVERDGHDVQLTQEPDPRISELNRAAATITGHPDPVRVVVGSIVVTETPGGICISRSRDYPWPGHVEHADIEDLHKTLGQYLARKSLDNAPVRPLSTGPRAVPAPLSPDPARPGVANVESAPAFLADAGDAFQDPWRRGDGVRPAAAEVRRDRVALKLLDLVDKAAQQNNPHLTRQWVEAYRMLVTAEVK